MIYSQTCADSAVVALLLCRHQDAHADKKHCTTMNEKHTTIADCDERISAKACSIADSKDRVQSIWHESTPNDLGPKGLSVRGKAVCMPLLTRAT